MVIMNNIMDINDLQLKLFKTLECPCELCSCGCFEKNKYTHNSSCKKQGKKTRDLLNRQTSLKCPLTHYRETFKANYNVRKPSAYLPIPDKYTNAQIPMDLNTIQKTEFQPIKNYEKRVAFKHKDNTYASSTEPFSTITSYQDDFAVKDTGILNQILHINPNQVTMHLPIAKMSNDTTSKDHYKRWSKSVNDNYSYTELPCIAYDSIFPTKERNFATTTSSVHKYMTAPLTEPYRPLENGFKENQSIDTDTVYRKAFIVHKDGQRANIIRPKRRAKSELMTNVKSNYKSQTKDDFIDYGDQEATKKAPNDFYSSNLNWEIYPDNIHVLTSTYSSTYPGHDAKENPRPKAFKIDEVYKPPVEVIDLETTTMREFKPLDVTKLPRLLAKKVDSKFFKESKPMESMTTSKANYIDYKVKPITIASDPMPEYYFPPSQKFAGITTNSEFFYPKVAEKRINCKPQSDSVHLDGSIDMTSAYRTDFYNHGLTMCGAKAYFIAKALEEKKKNAVVQ